MGTGPTSGVRALCFFQLSQCNLPLFEDNYSALSINRVENKKSMVLTYQALGPLYHLGGAVTFTARKKRRKGKHFSYFIFTESCQENFTAKSKYLWGRLSGRVVT